MIVLDASVLIAHLNPHDMHHSAATQILLDASPGTLLVHTITLSEVLVGGARIVRGEQMYADLLSIGIQLTEHDEQEPLRLAELRAISRLKLPDCCVLDAAVSNKAPLATFDDALAAAAAQRGIEILPRA
ncbi:type II toxin-antitoxin system VapC family toxin [Arthrobacter pigmenti]